MTPDLHGAWTDAVLALACFGGAAVVLRADRSAWPTPLGLVLIGLAAAVGTVRLGGVEALGPVHDGLSQLAGLVGVPLAGVGAMAAALGPVGRGRLVGLAGPLLAPVAILGFAMAPGPARLLRTAVSAAFMLATLGIGLWGRQPAAVAAPVIVIVAGLGIAGDGTLAGVSRDAWFHLSMALAAGCFAVAARTSPG